MVKLVRVERACEQTGNPACPLIGLQLAAVLRSTKLADSCTGPVVRADVSQADHAGIHPLDSRWKPVKRTLFVRRKG